MRDWRPLLCCHRHISFWYLCHELNWIMFRYHSTLGGFCLTVSRYWGVVVKNGVSMQVRDALHTGRIYFGICSLLWDKPFFKRLLFTEFRNSLETSWFYAPGEIPLNLWTLVKKKPFHLNSVSAIMLSRKFQLERIPCFLWARVTKISF